MQKHFNKNKRYNKINSYYLKKEDHTEEKMFRKRTNKAWIPPKTIIILKHL